MIRELRTNGIVELGLMAHARETLLFLLSCRTYHGHVKGASVARRTAGNSTCWGPDDVLRAPHFFEFAIQFTDLASEYLAQAPHLYSVNAFTTYPIDGPLNPDIQEWHRDKDDVKFLALFVYLTDVLNDEDGAHLYQRGTQQGATDGGIHTVRGPAGTAFIADGRGLHMGLRPTSKPRTIAWARWGVSDPPASYLWDKIQPVSKDVLGARYPHDPDRQASIRLVVQ